MSDLHALETETLAAIAAAADEADAELVAVRRCAEDGGEGDGGGRGGGGGSLKEFAAGGGLVHVCVLMG